MEVKKQIEQTDWENLSRRLLFYTSKKVEYIFGRVNGEILLLGGKSPEDIVYEAIARLLDGTRNWNPERVSLWVFLKRTIDSIISHYSELKETQSRAQYTTVIDGDSSEDEEAPQKSVNPVDSSPNPEEIKISNERMELLSLALNRLLDLKQENEQYCYVLMCMQEGIVKASGISDAAGIEVSQVYSLKRRIKRDFDRILLEMCASEIMMEG